LSTTAEQPDEADKRAKDKTWYIFPSKLPEHTTPVQVQILVVEVLPEQAHGTASVLVPVKPRLSVHMAASTDEDTMAPDLTWITSTEMSASTNKVEMLLIFSTNICILHFILEKRGKGNQRRRRTTSKDSGLSTRDSIGTFTQLRYNKKKTDKQKMNVVERRKRRRKGEGGGGTGVRPYLERRFCFLQVL